MEREAADTSYYRGLRIELHLDDNADNPRTAWDNVATFWCWHGRYNLGDLENRPKEAMREAGLRAYLREQGKTITAITPLYMFDHSGITISTTPFNCPWDSGQIGYAFVTADVVKKEGIKRNRIKWAERMIESEVEVYDKFVRGDCYGYTISKPIGEDDWGDMQYEEIDSCWGYYGMKDAGEQALEAAKSQYAYMQKQRFEKLKDLIRNKVSLLLRENLLAAV